MIIFHYKLRLTSDAEPGTGMGGENINSLVPRDTQRRLKINGSHIKGLMREQFTEISQSLAWDSSWCDSLFGQPNSQSDVDAAIRFGDAIAADTKTLAISRTAVGDDQTKVEGSLRTTEAVPAGTEYEGQLYCDTEDPILIAAVKLTLSSINAVGGSRSRGAGACVVTIDETPPDFGELLKIINAPAKQLRELSADERSESPITAASDLSSDPVVCLRLTFRATEPVCCPEVADKTNTIRTGFAIPASAVQGVILHRLHRMNSGLSQATFEDTRFLAWPLLPIGDEDSALQYRDPIRVGLTHRGAKFALGDAFRAEHFQDEAIESFDWTRVPDGAPLKAFDGVLLQHDEGVKLWKASQMPHVISAHGVRNDQSEPELNIERSSENSGFRNGGRNLFSVDSMAPLVWTGKVFLPQTAADALVDLLKQNAQVTFGKGRSVRGHGHLSAERIDAVTWRADTAPSGFDVLVAQSPWLVPTDTQSSSAEAVIEHIVADWIETNGLQNLVVEDKWGATSLRFGWNRTTRTDTKTGGFESARLVIDPGATVKLNRRLNDDELAKLAHGIGGGRQQGYGAVSLHPGKAMGLYTSRLSTREQESGKDVCHAIQTAIRIAQGPMPSSSQWSALRSERIRGQEQANQYLERQLEERTSRIHATWVDAAPAIRKILHCNDKAALSALTFLTHKAADRRSKDTQ